MATVLVDTCSLLWAVDTPENLGAKAREVIGLEENRVLVSCGTLWELSIKVGLGKLELPEGFFQELTNLGYERLGIEDKHLVEYRKLPLHHRDPFDRLLVAQAKAEGIPLVTCDPEIGKYGTGLIW
jgi:PIN domain nuclease of toxin-antitoxin system